jgi:SRSO17 transposase
LRTQGLHRAWRRKKLPYGANPESGYDHDKKNAVHPVRIFIF